jgi:pimeloyl-ACP methyl ester carboxylesterase
MSRSKSIFKLIVATIIFAALSACSGIGSMSQAGTGIAGTNLSNFSYSKDFYAVPSNIQGDPLGYILRLQFISHAQGYTNLRIMYVSKNTFGQNAAVTGLISYPDLAPPKNGWPVIAWDHGTSGLSQDCAPSRSSQPIPNINIRAVYVATDYLGLGPDNEIHPYLNRVGEAESTIDIVRAARRIPDAHAGNKWVVIGDSQGGHAALATSQIAANYAPDLDLLGTVSIGPGAELAKTYPSDNPIVYDTVEIMAMYGAQSTDPQLDIGKYLTQDANGVLNIIKTQCVDQIASYLLNVYLKNNGAIFTVQPNQTTQGKNWVKQNDVIYLRSPGPILIIGGGQDPIAVPARVKAAVKQLCNLGDVIYYDYIANANHNTEMTDGFNLITSWVRDRFAGKKAPDNCDLQS